MNLSYHSATAWQCNQIQKILHTFSILLKYNTVILYIYEVVYMGNVLIVDDSSLIRSVASSAAKEAGHNVIVAGNGQEGLDAMKNNEINIVFSDVNMPVMGGLEMVKNIKNDPAYKFIPVIMLTTESNPELKAKGKALGVKAWMLKPFNKDKFFMALKKLLA